MAEKKKHQRLLLYGLLVLFVGGTTGYISTFFGSSLPRASDIAKINTGDTAWVLVASALVMLMVPAVGFFYGGMVGSKNVVSVIKQSLLMLCLVSLQWMVAGYSLVFGEDIHGFIGNLQYVGLKGVGFAPNMVYAPTIPHLAFMIFQAMFAIITPALIIGSFVGRIRFRSLIIFILLWTTLVYDPIAHWVWADSGWLHRLGALDFAGGTVVHISAGFAGLAAALIVGRRHGVKTGELPLANNVPLMLLGAALLWFGWFGFNAGSALSASGLAVSAFVVTNIAAAAAGTTWMLLSWAEHQKPSAMATATGAVCGLVAITPASGFAGPVASVAIGIIAGLVTYVCLFYRGTQTKIDDTLDVWAAHGMGGVVGAILTGVFAEKAINTAGANGLLFGNPSQVITQILAVGTTLAYAFLATLVILFVLKKTIGLRVPQKEEKQGLDLAVHGEAGYRL